MQSLFSVRASEFQGEAAWLADMGGVGSQSSSGVQVSEGKALTASSVFACVRVIAEDVAKLPTILYRRVEVNGGKGKERAVDHPLYPILHLQPNDEMSAYDMGQAVMVSVMLWGNGYAEIHRVGGGDVAGIVPLEPWRVFPTRTEGGVLAYEYREPGVKVRTIQTRNMLHVKGISPNGVLGWMLTEVGRESIGLGLAAMDFTGGFFANGASQGEAVVVPRAMKAEEFRAWVTAMRGQYEGQGKQHRTRYFDQDVKLLGGGGIAPKDSQLIETLHFSVEDIARYFRVTPHKIGHLLRATFSNVESLDLDHYKSTIQPRLVQLEQEMAIKLLTTEERQTMVIEHLVDALLRADFKTRTEGYGRGLTDGWLNVNEVRSMENLNPIAGGDRYRMQVNLAVIDDEGNPVTAGPAAESDPDAGGVEAEQAKARFMPVFAAEATRVIDREAKAIGRKKPGEVGEWAEKWYDGQRAAIASAMTPPCVSLGAFVGVGYRDAEAVALEYAEKHVAESRRLLSSAGGDVSTELERWRIERPAMIAQHLTDEVCHARS